ncbi:MAG: type II CRISPR-associated endonuclease Cas1, partial [Armatimonadetes bacterium RBG_16_58_9]
NHMPSSASVPFAGHSRAVGIQRLQLSTTLPFRKRCWQAVAQAKIRNQAECLRLLGRAGADRIEALADEVASGDTGNVESRAAREYFRYLFGPSFARGEEDGVNSALNYGYAVIRAAVARALAASGFILTQGIHHCSELNPFNLADDFMEPLRPVADLLAASFSPPPEALEKEHRERLAAVLGCEVGVDGEAQSILRGTELMAGSFGSACKAGDPKLLKLPGLLPLQEHAYE